MKKLVLMTLALLLCLPGLAMGEAQDVTIPGEAWDIPATVTMPEGEGPFPFVVMFHGTGSDRNEAGGGYVLLAQALADAGIASARFDFVGNGQSEGDYIDYTLTSGMRDGMSVIEYMRAQEGIDADRLGLVGWSQGGTVAMLTAARNPGVRSMVTWAGALDMSDYMADFYEVAKQEGYATVEFDWREPLNLSIEWYDEVREINLTEELRQYDGAILALAGENDDVVPSAVSYEIIDAVQTEAKEARIIQGADHTFNIFSGEMETFEGLIYQTVDWFGKTL